MTEIERIALALHNLTRAMWCAECMETNGRFAYWLHRRSEKHQPLTEYQWMHRKALDT